MSKKKDEGFEAPKFKQYAYRTNANLVLQLENRPRPQNEPSGEPSTLRGKELKKFGDLATLSKPPKSDAEKQRAKSKPSSSKKKILRKGVTATTSSVLSVDDQALVYQPKTDETQAAYENLLYFVQPFLGDVSPDALREATDEVIQILKDEKLMDPERLKELRILLKDLSDDDFAKLVQKGKELTDFSLEKAGNDESIEVTAVDADEQGISVVFNDEQQAEEEDEETVEENAEIDGDDTEMRETLGTIGDIAAMEAQRKHEQGVEIDPHSIDAFWLQRELAPFYKDANVSQKMSQDVLQILAVDDNRECENRLVLLLEHDKFKLIQKLMKNRWKIVYCTRLARAADADEKRAIEDEMANIDHLAPILNALRGNETEKKLESKRKERNQVPLEDEQMEDRESMETGIRKKLELELENLSFDEGSHFMSNKSVELPNGSKRIQYKSYEEVLIPALKPPEMEKNEKFVPISELPQWARTAFGPREKSLNRVQSRIYESAFFSPENLLLCAPTGAGKTIVAVLCILHEIGLHLSKQGELLDKDFKIIYIAPMKALVQEVVGNMSSRLNSFGINVQELTGDRNMTKEQINATQIIVTTPEKWDIVTRKSADRSYVQQVKLIIIDEVHLLHDDRGPVLEAIVARTIRQQESTQEMIRIVGLSATLPNYKDVATFLRVKPSGLFHFDASFRPVPLQQQYIGVSERKALKRLEAMNQITFEKVLEQAGRNQVLVFVHSRKETAKTGKYLRDTAIEKDVITKFLGEGAGSRAILNSEMQTVKNADLKDLLPYGFAIHHAGMTRADRTLVEDLFQDGHVQVLVSTATLAWGVNLPAHSVIIKGTQIYNPEKSSWVELSALDVMQMFGRAGRPQFDASGEGIIVTTHGELQFYLSLLNQQLPIESQFIRRLPDALNAEIVLGTVQNVKEAIHWLGYTYLQVRMMRNPVLYGLTPEELAHDKYLEKRRGDLIHSAATLLDKHNLIKYDKKTGIFRVTDLGRVASHYYIPYKSISTFNEHLKPTMSDIELFRIFSLSEEFKYMSVRQEEKLELQKLLERVPVPVKEGIDDASAKVNVLLQAHISHLRLEGFALMADMVYVTQSAARIVRALFEISMKRGWAQLAEKTLTLAKMIEKKMWLSQSPLRQFKQVPPDVVKQLEKKDLSWDRLYDLNPAQLGDLVRVAKVGSMLYKYIHQYPRLDLTAHVQPITRSLLRVELTITPDFQFSDKVHGAAESFWIMVVDVDGELILHQEVFVLKKKFAEDEHFLSFTVPIFDPVPPQYFIKVLSDRWLGPSTTLPISFRHLILPERYPAPTELLDLQPLPISGLRNPKYEQLYSKFKHFNPIQTQVFNILYDSDENTLIAAPTGSGKTVCAEIAILRTFNQHADNTRCVYVAPIEQIAQRTFKEWSNKFEALQKSVYLLTGDQTYDLKLLEKGNICICTPEQWDILSRKTKSKKLIQQLHLFIADELHLIGAVNGHILEAIVSRMRFITAQPTNDKKTVRMLGLCAPVANAKDLGEWIGASVHHSLFNFHPSVRPVPLDISIQGFAQQTFSSRMVAMVKPALQAIKQRSNNKPVLIFVPSRKQARFCAIELVTYIAAELNPRAFIGITDEQLQPYLDKITNKTLLYTLKYGVAIHHEDLSDEERQIVEHLHTTGIIKILISTYNLCWSMDQLNAHLVIIMGTQYYDGKEHRYADYSIPDILQMMGRASRPLIDDSACCFIFCHAPRKEYYKKFLNEPFPVESHLNHFLADHLNTEIANKSIKTKQDAVNYFTWTFFYRRLRKNPNYYNLHGVTPRHLSEYLSDLTENTLNELQTAKCIATEEGDSLVALNLGMIASHYYIKYTTIELFSSSLNAKTKLRGLIEILSVASEFDSLPIRQKEDDLLRKLASHLPLKIAKPKYNDPHTKANILLQCHFSRTMLNTELEKDKELVLSLAAKLIQAMVDVTSSNLWLTPSLAAMELSQMVVQATWDRDPFLLQLPYFTLDLAKKCEANKIETIYDLIEMEDEPRNELLQFNHTQMVDVAKALNRYPSIDLEYAIEDPENVTIGSSVTLNLNIEVEEQDSPAHAPFFPKEKWEEWWIVLGDPQTNQLIAIRRRAIQKKTSMQIKFLAPKNAGEYTNKIYLMCDSYMGCDHEYTFDLKVHPGDEVPVDEMEQ